DLQLSNAVGILLRLAQNGPVLAGLACYAISVVVWILALARVDVSIAYPMLSLGYIVNALGAWWLFDENVTLVRVAGMLVIGVGTWLVAQT
ncbi:MAG: SMR family transporter, partial [Gammaproteobacteria bacterium]